MAEHGWDWGGSVHWKTYLLLQQKLPPRKRKRKKNESTVTLKSLQPAENKIKHSRKTKDWQCLSLFYQLALEFLTTGGISYSA